MDNQVNIKTLLEDPCCLDHLGKIDITFYVATDTVESQQFVGNLTFSKYVIDEIQATIRKLGMFNVSNITLNQLSEDDDLSYEIREVFYDELVTNLVTIKTIHDYFTFVKIISTYQHVHLIVNPTDKYLQLAEKKFDQYEGRYIFSFEWDPDTKEIISLLLVGSPGS
jgi:hypothetical protein